VRVIGYVRVSSKNQADQAESGHAQADALRAWCADRGHALVDICTDDGVSGTNGLEDRVGLPEALNRIKAGEAEALLVRELDRLSRDLMVQETVFADLWAIRPDTEMLSTKPDELANCSRTDDPDEYQRKFIRRQLGLVAELVRDLTVARLRAGKRRKAAAGGFIGGQVPFGYRAEDHNLTPDAAEQATLERVRQLRAEGASLAGIARQLTTEGYPAKRGGRWYPQTVSRVIDRLEA
jgi:DNA invertase Pin-like site-specific DNA recombinase